MAWSTCRICCDMASCPRFQSRFVLFGDRKSYTGHGPCPIPSPQPICAIIRTLSLVEGSVFEHAVDDVAASSGEADDGGVVVFALFAFAFVAGGGHGVFDAGDERGLPQRVLESFVASSGGAFAFDAGAGLAGDGGDAGVRGQVGRALEAATSPPMPRGMLLAVLTPAPGIDVRTVGRGWPSGSFSTCAARSRRRSLMVLMSRAIGGG